MLESFLHLVWRSRLFEQKELKTISGEDLLIKNPGELNEDSGPDFSFASIKIGNQQWIGHVEIHKKSSDWARHGHQNDAAYNAVILHVCFECDQDVYRLDGTLIPQLELKSRISQSRMERHRDLNENLAPIPCSFLVARVTPLLWKSTLDRMFIERIEIRSREIWDRLEQCNGDWGKVYWEFLCRSFGMKKNKAGFDQLARLIDHRILERLGSESLKIEALLFGISGMLKREFIHPYIKELHNEYRFLKKKYNTVEMNVVVWKFMRMRPNNFPTIRLVQLAGFITQFGIHFETSDTSHYFSLIKELKYIPISEFWQDHYTLAKSSTKSSKKPGEILSRSLLVNVFVPMLFAYWKSKGQYELVEEFIERLKGLKAESNQITRQFEKIGLKAENLWEGQALLHLHNNYCTLKRCNSCIIGKYLLCYEKTSDRNMEKSN